MSQDHGTVVCPGLGHAPSARCAGRQSRSATLSTIKAVSASFLQSRLKVAVLDRTSPSKEPRPRSRTSPPHPNPLPRGGEGISLSHMIMFPGHACRVRYRRVGPIRCERDVHGRVNITEITEITHFTEITYEKKFNSRELSRDTPP